MAGCVDSPDGKGPKTINKSKRSLSLKKKSIQHPTEETETTNTTLTSIPRSLSKKRTKDPITATDAGSLEEANNLPPAVPRSLSKRRTKECISYYEGPDLDYSDNFKPPLSLSKRRIKEPISKPNTNNMTELNQTETTTTTTTTVNEPSLTVSSLQRSLSKKRTKESLTNPSINGEQNHLEVTTATKPNQPVASIQRSLSKKRTKEPISQSDQRIPVDAQQVSAQPVRLGLPPRPIPIPKKKSILCEKNINVAIEKPPAKKSMLPRKSFGTIEENKEMTEITDSIIECSVNVKNEPLDNDYVEVMINNKKSNSSYTEETNIF